MSESSEWKQEQGLYAVDNIYFNRSYVWYYDYDAKVNN